MTKSRLELRSIPMIGLGFVIGPMVGLTCFWALEVVVPGVVLSDPSRALAYWIAYVGLGGAVCLAVEAVVIVPILLGFQRYRWGWLNGWTAAVIGAAVGAIFWTVALVLTTPAPPMKLLTEAIDPGMVGLIAAVVFRLIAVRRAPEV
ncbi:MAG TPA: hypothetical protein VII42_13620 [Caulobacteraceae bacterium]|jgi:uncharacterized membrane protein